MYYDPYQVLGVSSDATDDEIKKAYRTLSRKYHPDSNINNPNREQAEEQFKKVQEAYEQIMKIRSGEASPGSYGPYGQSAQSSNPYGTGYRYREPNQGYSYGPFGSFYQRTAGNAGTGTRSEPFTYPKEFDPAVKAINARSFAEALNYLNRMNSGMRGAVWYYLRANANYGLNNRANAMEDAEMAVRLEPNNMRYRGFYQRLRSGMESYRTTAETYGRSGVTGGDLCLNLCLISLCCPCNGPC